MSRSRRAETDSMQPVDFGYKTAWWAVRSHDMDRVAQVIDLREAEEMPWQQGFERAMKRGFFITPPVGQWSLIVGDVPPRDEDPSAEVLGRLLEISAGLGAAQVFATHRVTDYHVWARADGGALVRGFGFSGERGRTLWNVGHVTAEEQTLGISSLDLDFTLPDEPDDFRRDDATFPQEEHVVRLAGLWSVDPTTLSSNQKAKPGMGIWGRWCMLSDNPPPRAAVKKPRKKQAKFKDLAELLLNEDFDRFKRALENGSDPNMKSSFAATPLWSAARMYRQAFHLREGAVEAMRLLLEAGADANLPSFQKERPLHKACNSDAPEQVALLLEYGADVNGRDRDGATPLFYCIGPEVAEALITAGADVNARDNVGKNALHRASYKAYQPMLSHGIEINARTKGGITPLHKQVHHEMLDAVRILLDHGADATIACHEGLTPRMVARDRLEKVKADSSSYEAYKLEKIAELEEMCRLLKEAERNPGRPLR